MAETAAPSPTLQVATPPASVGASSDASPRSEESTALAAPSEPAPALPALRLSIMDRLDRLLSRLSTRNHFWQRVTSLVWLPYAFRSGIRMKRLDQNTFSAILPFRRANRNWYNAMAGAALLANSEIAGGMYVFGVCGGEYTVVCKHLEYRFLRPCHGPAVYRITPRENLAELLALGKEFNITLDMEIYQQSMLPETVRPAAEAVLPKAVGETVAPKAKRVGRCVAVFHVTPKTHQQSKGRSIR